MGRTRDWRRAQRERVIDNTRRWMLDEGHINPYSDWWSAEDIFQAVRFRAANPTPCSCMGCGNPRKWWSGFEAKTMQEHRADLRVRDED